MTKHKPYSEHLEKVMQDPEEAASYLNAALEDGDPRVFLLALRDVAKARGDTMLALAKRTKLNRENLYKMLSAKGNPALTSLNAVLDALGLHLAVEVKGAVGAI